MDDPGPGPSVRFGVLGPLEVVVDRERLVLGGPKQTLVLALLLLEPGRVVSTDRLIDTVWGEAAGERSLATLQVYVSNLRKALEPARRALGLDELIVTRRPGYLVTLGPQHVDVLVFTKLLAEARAAVVTGRVEQAVVAYRAALAMWRGEVLAGMEGVGTLDALRARLEGEHHAARLERFDAELAAGQHVAVLAELQAAVAADPLDERLRGQLILALYRSGRQAEALSVFQDARARLIDELGIEPGRELRQLEAQVLRHDPALDLRPPLARGLSRGLPTDGPTVVRTSTTPSVWLVVDGQRIPLARTITTIGRRADRHVVLDGDDVSRAHAEIRRLDSGVEVVDVGSANGTRVNGTRIARAPLHGGDEIVIGRHVLRLEAQGEL